MMSSNGDWDTDDLGAIVDVMAGPLAGGLFHSDDYYKNSEHLVEDVATVATVADPIGPVGEAAHMASSAYTAGSGVHEATKGNWAGAAGKLCKANGGLIGLGLSEVFSMFSD